MHWFFFFLFFFLNIAILALFVGQAQNWPWNRRLQFINAALHICHVEVKFLMLNYSWFDLLTSTRSTRVLWISLSSHVAEIKQHLLYTYVRLLINALTVVCNITEKEEYVYPKKMIYQIKEKYSWSKTEVTELCWQFWYNVRSSLVIHRTGAPGLW